MMTRLLRGIALVAGSFIGWANAASIGACHRADLCISGMIDTGDAVRFAAVAKRYPAGTVVWLDGPGGRIVVALDIGDIIQRHGFSTAVSINNGYCASACAVLFLSGTHAIIERNSLLLFHQGYDPETGQAIDAESTAAIADHIAAWGVTKRQSLALLNAAPPSGMRPGTEAWARWLGFQYVIIPSYFGAWRSCSSKFCVAVP
jgi:hypothetical protein